MIPLPGALGPLCEQPQTGAVFLDFDGTLSPIVDDPALARPLDGVPEVLGDLGAHFGVVAVISGRPAAFLDEHLGRPDGVRLIGLYGLEEVGEAVGPTTDVHTVGRWRSVMAEVAEEAERTAPDGVSVERKPVTFTLHFRQAPDQEEWVRQFADEQRDRLGLLVQPGRMAIELRPGLDVDKGTVVRELAQGCTAACCFGDDLGDLAAFSALGDLARSGISVVRVAVTDDESPLAVSEAADLTVVGPAGAIELLRAMVAAAAPD